jgi:hypothetical protein
MVITIGPNLEKVLTEQAAQRGIAPEALAITALRDRFLGVEPIVPQDEWERRLLEAAKPYGAALSNEALSSEGLYD